MAELEIVSKDMKGNINILVNTLIVITTTPNRHQVLASWSWSTKLTYAEPG